MIMIVNDNPVFASPDSFAEKASANTDLWAISYFENVNQCYIKCPLKLTANEQLMEGTQPREPE